MNVIYRMFIYDFMYVAADQLIKKCNPCQIQITRSGMATCISDTGPCCTDCKHLSNSGCTVTCLGCKLGLCDYARKANPDLADKLMAMGSVGFWYGLRCIRTSRQSTYSYLRSLGKRTWRKQNGS